MPLRLHNSLSRQLETFVPIDPAHVTFYSCGPTVYDDAHIGNFRAFLAADTLRRWIESPWCELAGSDGRVAAAPKGGRKVTHVMNITDVGHMTEDDADGGGEDRMAVAGRRLLEDKKSGKLPADAAIDPSDPYAIADFYASRFLRDARTLGLKVAIEAQKDPSLMPRPTQKIPGMIDMVRTLIAKGHAYAVGPPGRQTVYFNVLSFPTYGRLSGNTLDKLREGAGGRVNESNQSEKRHPADFMLWKSDPAHIMKWDSPWGPGYPGWHLECSVMAAERLRPRTGWVGDGPGAVLEDGLAMIDLHSGGEDNTFPHHECELAQSCCAFNATPGSGSFARVWFHVRHLFVEGRKMSKSLGNFFTIRDLEAKGYEPAAIRLELIKTHYRTNANFTEQGLKDSTRVVERWRRFVEAGATVQVDLQGTPAPAQNAIDEFTRAMHDDLNVAAAIAAVNTWVSSVSEPTSFDVTVMRGFDRVLGVLERQKPADARTDIGIFVNLAPDPAVVARLEARRAARAAKDFATSDAIRDELLKMGYAIKDVAGGQVEVRKA
jgi:cysteinyl-tRNA synthetase